MKTKHLLLSLLLIITSTAGYFVYQTAFLDSDKAERAPKVKLPREARQAERNAYLLKRLRIPGTNDLPSNARERELRFKDNQLRALKTTQADEPRFDFIQAGPSLVGGRTRTIAYDVSNTSNFLTGGVSGGIWKSYNSGGSWELKTIDNQNLPVTHIAQDTRDGHTDTWYASTGEYYGNSTSDLGSASRIFGSGIYKSTDGGESWFKLDSFNPNRGNNPNVFDHDADFVEKVVVNPQTGSVFLSSNASGIYRSQDEGDTWDLVMGEFGSFYFPTVAVAQNGALLASMPTYSLDANEMDRSGIFKSTDDGENWTRFDMTPYPAQFGQAEIAFAPSNNDVAYILTQSGNSGNDVSFHKINVSAGTLENRTANIPGFGGSTGDMSLQGAYNIAVAVKPDDENFVVIGGVNLYRSTDGFASELGTTDDHWIGGYTKSNDSFASYAGHHPDQHAVMFSPNNNSQLYSSHDGGISFTRNVTSAGVNWQLLNSGYYVTQFYEISIDPVEGSGKIFGGAQDNGTPSFNTFASSGSSTDLSSGDGAFSHYGNEYAYVSSQNAFIQRQGLNASDRTPNPFDWSVIQPAGLEEARFIHVYAVDPNNDNNVYIPDGNGLWRSTQATGISNNNSSGAQNGWDDMRNVFNSEYGFNVEISALAVSTTPADILYFAGSSDDSKPVIYRVDNASTASAVTDSTLLTEAEAGTYVHHIAINKADADEILVSISNYETNSIFHSTDGGSSFSLVDGTLSTSEGELAPSVRAAAIVNIDGEHKVYLAGTSLGLYSTQNLNGSNTVWTPEGGDLMRNVLVNDIEHRDSDGAVAVGTHGRGAFYGTPKNTVDIDRLTEVQPEEFVLRPNYPNPFNPSTQISYRLAEQSEVTLSVYDINGRKVADLVVGQGEGQGVHNHTFEASNLASGTYLYTINAIGLETGKTYSESRKMTLVK